MKRIFKIGGLLLAMVVVLLAAIPLLIDANQFRGIVQSQLESALNRKVTLGDMQLRPFPLRLRVQGLEIGDDPAFATAPFLKAKEFDVHVALAPLLQKQVQVDSLLVNEPSVRLIRNADGRWNFSTIGKPQEQSQPQQSQPLTLGKLELLEGSIEVTDKTAKKPPQTYDHIDLRLRDIAPGRPLQAQAAVHIPGNVEVRAELTALWQQATRQVDVSAFKASLGALQLNGKGKADLAATPARLDFEVRADKAQLDEIARLGTALNAFPPDTKVKGVLNANLRITGEASNPSFSGTLQATQFEVLQKGWQDPVRTPDLRVTLTPQELTTKPFVVQTGRTALNASATISGYTEPQPRLRASLSANDADLAELLRVAAAYGVSSAAQMKGKGAISFQIGITGTMANLDYQGEGSIQDASLELPSLTQPLGVKNAKLRFTETGVDLNDMACSLAGSNVRGTLKVRNFSAPRIEFDADVDRFEAGAWQKLMADPTPAAAPGAKGSRPLPKENTLERLYAHGDLRVGELRFAGLTLTKAKTTLSLDRGLLRLDPLAAEMFGGTQLGVIQADLRRDPPAYSLQTKLDRVDANQLVTATTALKNLVYGALGGEATVTVAPKPGEDMAKSMTGNLRFALTDGKLTGVSMLNELSSVAKFAGFSAPKANVTDILGLSGTLNVRDGRAHTDDLKLSFAGGALGAIGSLGLADQSLQLKILSVLDKDTSERVGGSRVGGYMTTALANANGELVIPCLVSGTFAKPMFTPDAAEFARLKVKSLLPTPKSAAGNVLDIIQGGKKEGAKGAGGALLDMLRGKKKDAAQPPQ